MLVSVCECVYVCAPLLNIQTYVRMYICLYLVYLHQAHSLIIVFWWQILLFDQLYVSVTRGSLNHDWNSMEA